MSESNNNSVQSKNKLIIVDWNSMFCAWYYGLRKYWFTSDEWIPTGGIYAMLKMIKTVINRHSPNEIIFTFDTASSKNENKETLSDYKENRSKKPEDFIFQLNKLKSLLPQLWFDVFESIHYEADDVIATKVEEHKNFYDEVNIRTMDTDMYQLLDKNVKVIKTDVIFGLEDLKRKFNPDRFSPDDYILYKSIVWDTSDNIKWVAWVWPKTTMKILLESNFNLDTVLNHTKIVWNEEIIRRNLKVITLNRNIDSLKISHIKWNLDEDNLMRNFNRLWIQSLDISDYDLSSNSIAYTSDVLTSSSFDEAKNKAKIFNRDEVKTKAPEKKTKLSNEIKKSQISLF